MTQSTNLKLDLLSATDLFDTDKIKSNFEKIDNTVLIPTKIIDNCVTDNSLLPLSAKQGKLLQDQITKLNGDIDISQGIFTDVADIVSDSNLYYEKIGPHLLYITGWIEIKTGTYNASYEIFKMDKYKSKINTMLHAIDVTKLTSPVYPIYVANGTGIASLKLNQTLTSSLNLQITSFIVV